MVKYIVVTIDLQNVSDSGVAIKRTRMKCALGICVLIKECLIVSVFTKEWHERLFLARSVVYIWPDHIIDTSEQFHRQKVCNLKFQNKRLGHMQHLYLYSVQYIHSLWFLYNPLITENFYRRKEKKRNPFFFFNSVCCNMIFLLCFQWNTQ